LPSYSTTVDVLSSAAVTVDVPVIVAVVLRSPGASVAVTDDVPELVTSIARRAANEADTVLVPVAVADVPRIRDAVTVTDEVPLTVADPAVRLARWRLAVTVDVPALVQTVTRRRAPASTVRLPTPD
jgi:hypothetical protein